MGDSIFSLHCLSQLSQCTVSLNFLTMLYLSTFSLHFLFIVSLYLISTSSFYLLTPVLRSTLSTCYPNLSLDFPFPTSSLIFYQFSLATFSIYRLSSLSNHFPLSRCKFSLHFLILLYLSTFLLHFVTLFISLTHFLTPLTIYFESLPSQSAMLSTFSFYSQLSLFSLYLCSTFSFYFLSSLSESNILLFIFLLFPARPSHLIF